MNYASMTDEQLRRAPYSTTSEIEAHDEEVGYRDGKRGGKIRAIRSEAYDRGLKRGCLGEPT